MDIDEVVQYKEDNLDYLSIHKPTFRRLFPPSSGFWKVSEGNPMWHSPLSLFSVVVTVIIFRISFSVKLYCRPIILLRMEYDTLLLLLPLKGETEGNVTLDFLHWLFKTLKKEGISLRNVGFWIKRLSKLSFFFFFWTTSSLSTQLTYQSVSKNYFNLFYNCLFLIFHIKLTIMD